MGYSASSAAGLYCVKQGHVCMIVIALTGAFRIHVTEE